MPGGLVARHHEQGEEVLELEVGERLPVGLGGEEGRDDVVLRLAPSLQGDLLGVAEDVDRGRRPERQQPVFLGVDLVDHHRRVLRIGVGDHLIAPSHHLPRVLLRNPEQAAQHPNRQLPGDLGDEVEFAHRENPIQDSTCESPECLLVSGDHFRGEPGLDETAEAGVLRRVELHHRPPGLQLVGVHFLDADAARCGEPVIVTAGFNDIGVAGDCPEARPVALLDPRHWLGLPESLEGPVWKAFDIGVVRGDVGVRVGGHPASQDLGHHGQVRPRRRNAASRR